MVAIGALLVVGAASYLLIRMLLADRAPVEHTHRVLDDLSGLQSLLQDAERGQRGYVITGDDSYLRPYDQAVPQIGQTLSQLRTLTADNPRQQDTLRALQPPVDDKLAELAETIRLRRTGGFADAEQVVRTNRGALDTSRVEHLLADMRQEELRLL